MLNFKHLHYFMMVARSGGIIRAAERLHLTPQTLSGQISQFEERIGAQLFHRVGRRLELSETGKLALSYAEEIFQTGSELEELLSSGAIDRFFTFRVGVADVLPKFVVHHLLAPVLKLPEAIRLICHEDRLDRLLADLALHSLDMVIADRPMPAGTEIKGYSHPLGESGIAFMASPAIAEKIGSRFPANLHGAPMLLPGKDSALHLALPRWLERMNVRPRIVGEFSDSALMKAFGEAGAGVFPTPTLSVTAVCEHYKVAMVGETHDIKERFFLISAERKLAHPVARAVSDHAKKMML